MTVCALYLAYTHCFHLITTETNQIKTEELKVKKKIPCTFLESKSDGSNCFIFLLPYFQLVFDFLVIC